MIRKQSHLGKKTAAVHEPDERRKIKAARMSVLAALLFSIVKIAGGFWLRSLGMVAAGVDSFMDLLASSINFFSMQQSIQPADPEHPYGHGKVENIASLFQALLLSGMGLLLIEEGIRQAVAASRPPDFQEGIWLMLLSAFASFHVGSRLRRIGKETESPLLQADAYHFLMDTYSNIGVVLGLLLSQITGRILFDRMAALLIGLWVIFSAYRIFRNSLDALMDKYIPPALQKEINRIILSHSPIVVGYHKMRTRGAGSQKLIDLHLVTCKERSLSEAHEIADHIEKEIEARIKNSDVIIHMEPCTRECPRNHEECEFIGGRLTPDP